MQKKYLILMLGLLLIIGSILIFKYGFTTQKSEPIPEPKTNVQSSNPDEISVIATKPDPLDRTILLPTQPFEITFNHPLENGDEFKHEFVPKFEHNIKTSDDKKTVIVTPKNTYPLGQEITLFIKGDTKFDGKKILGREIIYHMQTIQYRGI